MPERLTEAPYGSWRSPIDAMAVARAGRWRHRTLTASAGTVYWAEARPLEAGRNVVVAARPGAAPADVTPPGFNARTRVHEYGGGEFAVHGTTVFFSNDADQRLYRQEDGRGRPRAITPEHAAARYADGRVTPDGRLLICVRERDGEPEHINDLVALPADGSREPRVIASGHDFYSSPRISPDGRRLAWLTWDHPRMPWEGSELWVAELAADGSLGAPARVAGGAAESVVQPEWSPRGVLHLISDRTGWWNLYRVEAGGIAPLTALEAELGGPLWTFAQSWYGFVADGRIACTYFDGARDRLAVLDGPGRLEELEVEFTTIEDLTTDGSRALFVGASPVRSARVVSLDLAAGAAEQLSADDEGDIAPAYVSVPRAIAYATTGGATAHALFYPPRNPDFVPPAAMRPPLLVRVHGGPTAHVTPGLLLAIQFFTSRGFAVVDVNYGGSTGYGRAYRERLRGQWGVVDTDDAVNAARHLAGRGEVDPQRMVISGGSAGGWTVLCALASHDVFAAGADYFGVSDLTGFVEDTHKFESRYNDWLVGPWPEAEALWRERSPINHADRIRAPVIVLQGLEDRVVPPSQSELVVAALAGNGVPHAYLTFECEQHGFRKAETIRRAIEAELYFYGRILGFEPADPIDRVDIQGL